ncbi:hypothetical protein I4U23_023277 [Adineta vaga]|nr:hypothetical protein I4U23_023277 [Adineta vaga]
MADLKLKDLTGQILVKLHEPIQDIESLNQWKRNIVNIINEIGEEKLSSSTSLTNTQSSSLDPVDWTSARLIAHETLNLSLDYIQYVRDRPVSQIMPSTVITTIEDEPLPSKGQSLSSVCRDVFNYVVPYARGNVHPRFWGWVSGEGTLGGVLADMISATININACSSTHSAAFVERTVIEWMRQIFGFPKDITGGLLVSGTSIATLISMAAARQRILADVRKNGLIHERQLIAYASVEAHVCVQKALELLGLGSSALHHIAVDENFQIKIDELKLAIRSDREKGFIPFCVIGNAGTVNTGAFDNLLEISSIARQENIWFHVDGAFGSFVILDPQRCHLVTGIDQADSVAFDFHKWLHCPFDAGCILIRDHTDLESTFAVTSPYLSKPERNNTDNKHWCYNLGIELSCSFRALKVWCTLKEHGLIKLGQKIADNCEQAQYFLSLLEQHQDIIRVVRPVSLNIVNFRFEPKEFNSTDYEQMNLFNNQLLKDIYSSGIAFPSSTSIENRVYIRVCIVSHRSTKEDFDLFIETIWKLYQTRLQTFLIN